VLLDGGIRRGSDVVKALALGAGAVMIGRAYLWGMAANGEAGVTNVLSILRSGIDEALLGLGHGVHPRPRPRGRDRAGELHPRRQALTDVRACADHRRRPVQLIAPSHLENLQ
jgi:hypothetical protein